MEACWAHNPEVDGSKPSPATAFCFLYHGLSTGALIALLLGSDVCVCASRVAQWKRAGPITQRSMDRNHPLLLLPFAFLFDGPSIMIL